ncbi:sigma-70 family RNA polymerase sigma factor [Frigoriglobus tundricola]|uniref:Thioredoxin domain-containing protein n=1 Tax=Frigoriglobus tundricola TaxID=2774151 RepID=A0A6M5YRB5_9BACT|nr:sigma-70 family RNA polymerase sigma factor [Frigoriglobus tundricola]QJW96595.1 hypothetical protein FTUN_4152 [Frigoriglobus tundricola]
MDRTASETAAHCLRAARAALAGGGATDADLLDRFVRFRDESAFELLVWRHRRLILGVCRRALRHEQDAEDAFQATFLVLARKAGTVGRGESLAGWLHTVAARVARAARAAASRRASRERPGVDLSTVPDRGADAPDLVPPGLLTILDNEIAGLPRKHREPLVLCYLEGMTYRQAADRLAVPVGTLSARLAKAKAQLQARLTRRGVGLPAAALALFPWGSARGAESEFVHLTARAAKASASEGRSSVVASPYACQLAERVIQVMYLTKLKIVAASVLAVFVLVGGAFGLAPGRTGEDGKSPRPAAAPDKGSATLRGTWTQTVIDEVTVGGKPQPPKERTITFVITDDRIKVLDDEGFVEDEMTYKLDPTASPAGIDLTSQTLGAFPGVYRLDGERLRIVYNGARGGSRPAEVPAEGAVRPFGLIERDLKRVSAEPKSVAQRFANAPGCFWMLPPARLTSFSTNGFVLLYEKDADGAAILTLAAAAATDPQSRAPEYRPVLFDAKQQRFVPVVVTGGSSSGRRDGATVVLYRWRMDPKVLPADKVARVGVEQLTAEAHRAAARDAEERARKRGVEVFPYPEVGKAYVFAVKTSDGKTVASKDLKGKVVVIDWWASWCGPCVRLLPEVKNLYEKRRGEGLEVVGVNLDRDPETATKASRRLGVEWPQVLVPDDEAGRELWLTAVGTESIPLVLVLDRKGVLRAINPQDLKATVGKLLDEEPKDK